MKWPIACRLTRLLTLPKSSRPRSGAVWLSPTRPMLCREGAGILFPLRHSQCMTVGFRDEALEDLEEIARYIARDNPAAASSVIARIHDVIYGTLALLPQRPRRARSARIPRPASALHHCVQTGERGCRYYRRLPHLAASRKQTPQAAFLTSVDRRRNALKR